MNGTYRLLLIFKKTHSVLNDDFILKSHQLDDLFGYPWPNDLQIDLAHIHLTFRTTVRLLSDKLIVLYALSCRILPEILSISRALPPCRKTGDLGQHSCL